MRVAAAIGAVVLLIMSIALQALIWAFGGNSTSWGVWVGVAMVCMIAAQCGHNLLKAARSGVGPRWNDPNSL